MSFSQRQGLTGVVFIATSLDGFIARENGELDWLLDHGGQGADYGYDAFMADIDAVLLGRHTYEKVLTFGTWPYGDRLVAVWTSRELPAPPPGARVKPVSGDARQVAAILTESGVATVYVDGGRAIQAFLDAGFIRRLIITRVPVLIGRGVPLFGPTLADITMRHVRTQSFPSGFVQSEYFTAPSGASG